MRGLMNLVGVFTLSFAFLLISSVVYTIAVDLVPVMTAPGSPQRHLMQLLTAVLGFNIFFNLIGSASCAAGGVPEDFTPEGFTPEEGRARLRALLAFDVGSEAMPRTSNGILIKVCSKCRAWKPPRTHHCMICNRCVLKMDHHCPWINGCVGYYNQRYFIGFLCHLLVGTGYSCLLYAHIYIFHGAESHAAYQALYYGHKGPFLMFVFALVASIFLAMLAFVWWNWKMATSNQTAIESGPAMVSSMLPASVGGAIGYVGSPFDLGKWQNLANLVSDRIEAFDHSWGDACCKPPTNDRLPVSSASPWRWVITAGYPVRLITSLGCWSGRCYSFGRLVWTMLPSIRPLPTNGLWYPTNTQFTALAQRSAPGGTMA